jgi:hypothetical protein
MYMIMDYQCLAINYLCFQNYLILNVLIFWAYVNWSTGGVKQYEAQINIGADFIS